MAEWSELRRARDNLRQKRPISTTPQILNAILDEIQFLKKEVRQMKKRKKTICV